MQAPATMEFEVTKNVVNNGTKSYVFSYTYIRKMVKVGAWNILVNRLNLKKDCFLPRKLFAIPYSTFQFSSDEPLCRKFIRWMAVFKDAFEKKYIREFHIYMVDNEKNVIENYKFKILFQKGRTGKAQSNLKEPTIQYLTMLESLQQTSRLPDNVKVEAEFFFNTDTPSDYSPPHCQTIELEDTWKAKIEKLKFYTIGELFTGYHMMRASGRGDNFRTNSSYAGSVVAIEDVPETEEIEEDNEQENEEIENEEQNDPEASEKRSTDENVQYETAFETEIVDVEDNDDISTLKTKMNKENTTTKNPDFADISYVSIESDAPELLFKSPTSVEKFNCICNFQKNDISKIDMGNTVCTKCKSNVHQVCHGFKGLIIIKNFVCNHCDGKTDAIIKTIIPGKQKHFYKDVAHYRIMLAHILDNEEFESIIRIISTKVIPKLRRVNVLDKNDKINEEQLISEAEKNFNHFETSNYFSEKLNNNVTSDDEPISKRRKMSLRK